MSGGRVHGTSENNTNVVAKTPILSLAFVCGRLLAVVSGERGAAIPRVYCARVKKL